ncbi:MAG: hypothetical protein AAFN93_12205, partial [Bacteroidota bacterium]
GTWKIVSVMSGSNLNFLWSKLLVRLSIVVGLMLLLYLVASIALNIPFEIRSSAFFATGLFYILFWFSLSFWIVSLKREDFNTLYTWIQVFLTYGESGHYIMSVYYREF